MSQYFPKLFRNFGGNINVKVDLSNYATKTDLKNLTHGETSSIALKTNLVGLKLKLINQTLTSYCQFLLIRVN